MEDLPKHKCAQTTSRAEHQAELDIDHYCALLALLKHAMFANARGAHHVPAGSDMTASERAVTNGIKCPASSRGMDVHEIRRNLVPRALGLMTKRFKRDSPVGPAVD